MADKVNIVGVSASVFDDAARRASLDRRKIITRHSFLDALQALSRAVQRYVTNSHGSISFTNFRRTDRVSGDIGAPLYESVNTFVDRGNRDHLDIFPGETAIGECAEDVVPHRKLGWILAGDSFAPNIGDVFDRRILFDD